MKRTLGLIIWFILLLMALASCAGNGGVDLAGTSWRLATLNNQQVVPGAPPTLFFEEDGSMGGNASCNSFGGEYKVRGTTIEISQLFSTLMACMDNDRMAQETLYMQMLGQVEQFEVTGGQLILTTTQGEQLIFLPAE
jgi:heat shock protein HslJ